MEEIKMENRKFVDMLKASNCEFINELDNVRKDYHEERRLIIDAFHEDIDAIVSHPEMTPAAFDQFIDMVRDEFDETRVILVLLARVKFLNSIATQGQTPYCGCTCDEGSLSSHF